MSETGNRGWGRLGSVAPADLRETRVRLHWLGQVFHGAANRLAEKRDDDSHTAFAWEPERGLFLGGPTVPGLRLAVTLSDLTVHVLRGQGGVVDSVPAAGRTLRETADAVHAIVVEEIGAVPEFELPDYDLPAHPAGDGAPFEPVAPETAREVGLWFANAHRAADRVRAANEHASPVRIWPHHFDLATLIALDPDEPDAEKARSVNVGMSPGDGPDADPYFYVSPWPAPDAEPRALPAGRWNTKGFFGAVLPADEVTQAGDGPAQEALVRGFVDAAVAEGRRLLDA